MNLVLWILYGLGAGIVLEALWKQFLELKSQGRANEFSYSFALLAILGSWITVSISVLLWYLKQKKSTPQKSKRKRLSNRDLELLKLQLELEKLKRQHRK